MKVNQLAFALAVSIGGGLWASLPLSALAAGNVDTTSGEASVFSPGGKPRALVKGDRVVEGDTIVTGNSGAVLITTDDSGVLAVRPRTRLTIDAYKVNGSEQDSVVLNLLRGSLRSITGWISKTAPKNYKITTSTATIGIRGTDHEVSIGEGAEGAPGAGKDAKLDDDSGTWNQVTEGATTLASPAGELEQKAGTPSATGRVKSAGLAPLLAAAPASLFKPQPLDARNAELKKDAQTNQQQRLDTRQKQVAAAGGTSAQGNPKVSTQCAADSPTQKAFDALIRAYEQGDVAFLRAHLSPSMVGYSTLINDVQTSTTTQRQTRIQIKDRQMQCGPDVGSVSFTWEKYFLDSIGFAPTVTSGQGAMLITGLGTGPWQVGGMTGNTPFTSAGGADGTVSVTANSVGFGNIPQACAPGSYSLFATPTITAGGPYSASVTTAIASLPTASCTIPAPVTGILCSWTVTGLPGGPVTVLGTVPTSSPIPTCTSTYTGPPVAQTYTVSLFYQVEAAGVSLLNALPGATYPLSTNTRYFNSVTLPVMTGGLVNVNATTSVIPNGCTANIAVPANAVALPPVCTVVTTTLPVAIEVRDPDLSGPSVQVQVAATGNNNNDIETFSLPRISPGVYRLSLLPVKRGGSAVFVNNGFIDLPNLNGAETIVNFTIRYNDAKSAAGVNVVRQTTLQLIP